MVRFTEAHGALTWSQRCFGDRWQGAVLGLAPPLRNPFCASTSSQRLSLGFPWDLVPPEDGLLWFVSRMLTYVARDLGDCDG